MPRRAQELCDAIFISAGQCDRILLWHNERNRLPHASEKAWNEWRSSSLLDTEPIHQGNPLRFPAKKRARTVIARLREQEEMLILFTPEGRHVADAAAFTCTIWVETDDRG